VRCFSRRTPRRGRDGSGDYAIAFSTSPKVRVPHEPAAKTLAAEDVANDAMSPLFLAVEEATEEAILNSLFMAETTVGRDGHVAEALPLD
jgi:D-aminopeptidase